MQKNIPFSKMHALGNDFIIVDGRHLPFSCQQVPITKLTSHHTGIGCDQLLWLNACDQADIYCRIFNVDGSEAEQCANGLRATAAYLFREHSHKKQFQIATCAGVFSAVIHDNHEITISLSFSETKTSWHELNYHGKIYSFCTLQLGNPHAIVIVDELKPDHHLAMAAQIHQTQLFPQGVNVGFVKLKSSDVFTLRTVERGAGPTLSCGSNTCAAFIALKQKFLLADHITADIELGQLQLSFDEKNRLIHLTGKAEFVFSGNIVV